MGKTPTTSIITYYLFKKGVHEETSIRRNFKYNKNNGLEIKDVFSSCKTLRDVKEKLIDSYKKEISSIFKEGYDFLLFKTNKRGLSTFQQVVPNDLVNSIHFLKDEDN